MRRRDFFRSLLGVAGAMGLSAVEMRGETVSGEEFTPEIGITCPLCGHSMWADRDSLNGQVVYSCCNAQRVYPHDPENMQSVTAAQEENIGIVIPGCPRFGIKYRAPKVRMERVP